jgi:spore coat polysaccharide biosynthesis predicted glycosyltransferase SpsG
MDKADLAVSATGTTVSELLATDTPTIGIPQVANQEPIATALAQRDAIVRVDRNDSAALRSSAAALVGDVERRYSLVETCRTLVDGRGAKRIFETIRRGVAQSNR